MTEAAIRVDPPAAPFRADVAVPGDKSLSHRALILAAMANGSSPVRGLGPGEDVGSTLAVLGRLGITYSNGIVASRGVDAWRAPEGALDCGNSGTTMRLFAGALAGRPFRATLTGDESLRSRPMRRLVGPLGALGASVEVTAAGSAPITVGGDQLRGAVITVPIASAQVRSALTLAAIQATGPTTIDSPPGFRDHTERWLETFGLGERLSARMFRVAPGAVPPAEYAIPGDPSSAAYLWASAAILPDATVTTPSVTLNPGRLGFLSILEAMGAEVAGEVTGSIHGDPVGTISVTGRGLSATDVHGATATAAIDELPLVAVLGAYAEGITTVRDAAELTTKESDRIATSVALIRALGGGAEPREDGFDVLGTGFLEGGTVASGLDHRIAMSAAVAATGALGPVTIEGATAAAVSWPTFFDDLETAWSSR